jgi:hypothetical protein
MLSKQAEGCGNQHQTNDYPAIRLSQDLLLTSVKQSSFTVRLVL